MNAPCRDCEQRNAECHGNCELYADWLKSREPGRAEKKRERDASPILCRKMQRHIWREMKRRQ
jgi:translation elongation factor EF-Ts